MIFVKKFKLFLMAIVFCSISCNHKPDTIKTELYFGLSNVNGPIAEEDWNKFQTETLDKTLDGYTLIKGSGYWEGNNSQTYSEGTIILIYIHEDSPAEDKKINTLIEKYKKRFNQESVLQTDQIIEAVF